MNRASVSPHVIVTSFAFRILGRDCNAELLQRHYFSGAHEDFAISQSKDAIIYVTVSSFFPSKVLEWGFEKCSNWCIGYILPKAYLMTLHKKGFKAEVTHKSDLKRVL